MALKGFLFGATLAAAVGPIALLIMHYGVMAGWRTALASGVGAACGDLTYALIAFTTGTLVLEWLFPYAEILRMLSSLLLVGCGLRMVMKSFMVRSTSHTSNALPRRGGPFLLTYFLTLVNPLTIVVFLGFSAQWKSHGNISQAVWRALWVFSGSLLVQLVYAVSGASLGTVLKNPRVIQGMNLLSGMAIVLFGVLGMKS